VGADHLPQVICASLSHCNLGLGDPQINLWTALFTDQPWVDLSTALDTDADTETNTATDTNMETDMAWT
jgi:hypothetical protein